MATTNATMINSAGQKVVVQAGSQQARDLFGKGYQLMKGNKYTPPTTAIPADQLGQNNSYGQISKILGANVQPNQLNSDTAGLLALSGATTAGEKEVDTLNTQLTTAMGSLGGKAADLQAEQDKQGVGSAVTQVKELTLGAAKLQGEIAAFDAETDKISSNLGDQAIPTGLIQGQQAQLNQQRTLMHNSKVAELTATNSLIQAFQGNITLGQKMAEDAVNMKYTPIENQIQTLQTQLAIAKEHMSREDAKRADIISAMMEERKQKTADAKELEKGISELAIQAAANGAPISLVNRIKNSKTLVDAAHLSSQYTPPSKSSGSSGGGKKTTAGSSYTNVTKTTDAGGGLAFFGKNSETGKQEPIGAAVYSTKKGIPLDQILNSSKNPADVQLVKDIKAARAQGDSDETILNDLYNSGQFNHLFVGYQ